MYMCTLSFLIVYCQFKKEDELIKTCVEVANDLELVEMNRYMDEILREGKSYTIFILIK